MFAKLGEQSLPLAAGGRYVVSAVDTHVPSSAREPLLKLLALSTERHTLLYPRMRKSPSPALSPRISSRLLSIHVAQKVKRV